MNIRNYITPALLAGAALLSSSAQAATATGTLNVQLVVNGNCTITAGGLVDFGTTASTNATPIQAQEDFTVNCTTGIPYIIEIDQGNGSSATVDSREMWDGTNDKVNYTLHRNSFTGPIWGDGTFTSTVESANGTGLNQNYTVYGVVPIQPTPGNATYLDTVTVSVLW